MVKAVPLLVNFLPPAMGGRTECLFWISFSSVSQFPLPRTSASLESVTSQPTTGVVREALRRSWVSRISLRPWLMASFNSLLTPAPKSSSHKADSSMTICGCCWMDWQGYFFGGRLQHHKITTYKSVQLYSNRNPPKNRNKLCYYVINNEITDLVQQILKITL